MELKRCILKVWFWWWFVPPSYPLLQGICSCKFFLHVSVQKIVKLKFLPLCRCPSGLNQDPEGTVKLRILHKAVAHLGNSVWVWTLHHLDIGECVDVIYGAVGLENRNIIWVGILNTQYVNFPKKWGFIKIVKPEALAIALTCHLCSSAWNFSGSGLNTGPGSCLFSFFLPPSFSPSLIPSFHWKKRANCFLGAKNKLVSYTCLQFADVHTEYFLSPWVIIHVISRLGFVEIFQSPGAPSRAHVIAWIQQYSSFSPLPVHPHSWGVSALW